MQTNSVPLSGTENCPDEEAGGGRPRLAATDRVNINAVSCAIIACVTLCYVGCLVGGTAMLVVVDILALRTNSPAQVHDACPSSSVWEYVMCNLAIVLLTVGYTIARIHISMENPNSSFQQSLTPDTRLLIAGITLGLAVWGSVNVFYTPCARHIEHLYVFKMAEVNVILSYICLGLNVLCWRT